MIDASRNAITEDLLVRRVNQRKTILEDMEKLSFKVNVQGCGCKQKVTSDFNFYDVITMLSEGSGSDKDFYKDEKGR